MARLGILSQVDAGHHYPVGLPQLMGSVTSDDQVDLDEAMAKRNDSFGVHHAPKAKARRNIDDPELHPCER